MYTWDNRGVTLVPTRRFWWLAAAGIPLAAVAVQAGAPAAAVAYDVGLVAFAWATARLGPDPRKLRIVRRRDPVLSVRRANRVVVTVENESGARLNLRLRDEPPPHWPADQREFALELRSGEAKEVAYHITPPARGTDMFRATYVRVRCPFGLVDRQEKIDTREEARVYPDVLALKEFGLLRNHGRLHELGVRRSRQRGEGTEFESLRPYTEGDDFRSVDWKATARHGEPIVRRHEADRNQAVIIVLDLGRSMLAEAEGVVKLDRALDAILMLAQAASLAGDQVGLLAYDSKVRLWVPPAKGRAQVGLLIRAAHDLQATPSASDPIAAFAELSAKWKRRALVVVFSDADDADGATPLAAALGPTSRRHRVFLCRVSDPKLAAARRAPLASPDGMYLRAAAALLYDERRSAGGILTGAGVRIIEADPENLAARLVATYLEARASGL